MPRLIADEAAALSVNRFARRYNGATVSNRPACFRSVFMVSFMLEDGGGGEAGSDSFSAGGVRFMVAILFEYENILCTSKPFFESRVMRFSLVNRKI